METLNYNVLKKLGYSDYLNESAPVKVLQFGEGNFLRAFVDYWFDRMNEDGGFNGKIDIVTPIDPAPGNTIVQNINEQEGLYTLYLRGIESGISVCEKRVISSVNRCLNAYKEWEEVLKIAANPDLRFIVSNTTEAGIVYGNINLEDAPPSSFPGKLCRFLYERWKNGLNGFVILSCELIDNNGRKLKEIVMRHIAEFGLEKEFGDWVEKENIFCSTLVDRIVTGYSIKEAPQLNEDNGYIDKVLDTGEIFGFWVIEGPASLYEELPIKEAKLEDHIIIVDDHSPYKQRKVRILNGAHTSFSAGAFLGGFDFVRDCVNDQIICDYINACIYDEIIPTLDLEREELLKFAGSVIDRFKNPHIDHNLLSICLNYTSKWKARVLPSVKKYLEMFGRLPENLMAGYAFYVSFYHNAKERTETGLCGISHGRNYVISDDKDVLDFYFDHKDDGIESIVSAVSSNEKFWGEDLTKIPGFESMAVKYMKEAAENGTYSVMKSLLG